MTHNLNRKKTHPHDLFNGKDLTGWYADVPAMNADTTLATPFFVRDGLLVSAGEPRGHLITDAVFQNYRLEVHYRFAARPGNAGVLIHASPPAPCTTCSRSPSRCR